MTRKECPPPPYDADLIYISFGFFTAAGFLAAFAFAALALAAPLQTLGSHCAAAGVTGPHAANKAIANSPVKIRMFSPAIAMMS